MKKLNLKESIVMRFGRLIYIVGIIAGGYWISRTVGSDIVALPIFFLSFWVIIGGFWLIGRRGHKDALELSKSLEKSETVKIISKVSNTSGSSVFVGTTYFVSFNFSNGVRKNFQVDINQYNSIAEGETGILTYKENENTLMFINFQPVG